MDEEARKAKHAQLLAAYKALMAKLTAEELEALKRFWPMQWE